MRNCYEHFNPLCSPTFKRAIGGFIWLREEGLNLRLLGYEPKLLPLHHPAIYGGEYRVRTDDLKLARLALSQLS